MTAAIDRLDGHHDALRAAGIEPDESLETAGDFTQESGVRAMEAFSPVDRTSTPSSSPTT